MKHDNDTIVRDICIAAGAVTAACIASLATTAKYLFHFCIDTQWKRSVFHQSLIAPERIEKLQQGEAQEAGEWFAQAKQPVTITSDDGLRLHGWLFDPDCTAPKPHLYAICMHGYTGTGGNREMGTSLRPHGLHRIGSVTACPRLERGTVRRHGLA